MEEKKKHAMDEKYVRAEQMLFLFQKSMFQRRKEEKMRKLFENDKQKTNSDWRKIQKYTHLHINTHTIWSRKYNNSKNKKNMQIYKIILLGLRISTLKWRRHNKQTYIYIQRYTYTYKTHAKRLPLRRLACLICFQFV